MLVINGLEELAATQPSQETTATIGVFDGVHLGHFAVIHAVVQRAQSLGHCPAVVTFDQHPKTLLLGHAPATVTSLEHRLRLFERIGVETCCVLPFNEELKALTAERFLSDHLQPGLSLKGLILGFDSKFGKGQGGTVESLKVLGPQLGMEVSEVPPLRLGERAVSSTAIREAVTLGDLKSAEKMLGRPVSLLGTVIRGEGKGKELGFPTANLDPHHELRPPDGVYASLTLVGDALLPAVVNIGLRPTFGSPGHSVEVHVPNLDADLYGQNLEVFFLDQLRGEEEFASADALSTQIGRDVEAALKVAKRAGDHWRIPGKYLPIEGSSLSDFLDESDSQVYPFSAPQGG